MDARPLGQISFIFITQFSTKILPYNNKIFAPILGLAPHPVWEILDPPLCFLGFLYIRLKAIFVFDLCRCCRRSNVNSKLDSL